MSEVDRAECRRNCWWVAGGAGIVLAVLAMALAGAGFGKAVLIGLVGFAILGFLLPALFCTGTNAAATPIAAPAPETPAEPAPPAAPAAPAKAEAVAEPVKMVADVPPAPKPAAQPKTVKTAKPAPKAAKPARTPASKPAAKTASALDAALAKSKDAPAQGEPEMLAAPRGGRADDLKMIRGVGPALEKILNEVGVWHFDQIASWKAKDIAFVDAKMQRFSGRITRDEWVKQAKILAKGGTTEFSERVSKGDMY